MKRLHLYVIPFVLAFAAGCGVDKEKIVGVWEVEDGPAGSQGMGWEFTSDGKFKVGVPPLMAEVGTYEISGSIITVKSQGKDLKGRIKELTDDRLVIKDDSEPKEMVFKKRKGSAAPTQGEPKLKLGDTPLKSDFGKPKDFPKLDSPIKDLVPPKFDGPLKADIGRPKDFPKLDFPIKDLAPPKFDTPLKDFPPLKDLTRPKIDLPIKDAPKK